MQITPKPKLIEFSILRPTEQAIDVPAVIFRDDAIEKKAFVVTIFGFPPPTNSEQATKYALQSLSRFFERHLDNPEVRQLSREAVQKKRLCRAYVNELAKGETSKIPFAIQPRATSIAK